MQSLLGTGVSAALVVERRDLLVTMRGGEVKAGHPPAPLAFLQAAGSHWTVSQDGGLVRLVRISRPPEVDMALSATVRPDGEPLSVGRAIFVLPRVALNGELHGVVGGGQPSEACGLDREVRVGAEPQTLGDFLDAVVREAPGLAWVMAWDLSAPRETLSLGVLCSDGALSLLGVYPSR